MRAPLALGVLILAFAVVFVLFVQSPAPRGVIDFSPPDGNFTGTTTITTTYGYVCVASLVSGAQGDVNGTVTTLTGVGMNCHPELYGSLQVAVGPEIFVVWVLAFAIALSSLAFYLHRKTQKAPALDGGNTHNSMPRETFSCLNLNCFIGPPAVCALRRA
jgi:hypothetical protein